jgi:Phosphotransferase enzyme family
MVAGVCDAAGDRHGQAPASDESTGHVWGSTAWRDAAESWAHLQLGRLGARPVGAMSELSDQRWSWVWRIPTDRGDVVLKQTTPARAVEGSVHAFCAEAAPEYVDRPLAYDPATARILFTDGGSTMAGGDWLAMPTPEAIASMVTDYAHLQQATIGRWRQAEAAGLPAWDPADAAHEAEQQAAILHDLPRSDPRRITAAQRDVLLSDLDALTVAGTVLANSPIPDCVDHGDLWPGNVLIARPGGRHRFIDFGDAAWTHPFLSLMSPLRECHRRWSLPGTIGDCRGHPALQMIIDAYLDTWTGYASSQELRDTLIHALRLTPLRRSRALITNVNHATSADAHDLGPTPWSWLEAATG